MKTTSQEAVFGGSVLAVRFANTATPVGIGPEAYTLYALGKYWKCEIYDNLYSRTDWGLC